MEIPVWFFFSLWAIIGVSFLKLGFNALDRTGLTDSTSPMFMSLFKHALAISSCHSSNYAFIFRPYSFIPVSKYCVYVMFGFFIFLSVRTTREVFVFPIYFFPFYFLIHYLAYLYNYTLRVVLDKYYMFAILAFLIPLVYGRGSESFMWYFFICAFVNLVVIARKPNLEAVFDDKVALGIFLWVESSLFLVGGKTKLYPALILSVAFLTSSFWTAISISPPQREQTLGDDDSSIHVDIENQVPKCSFPERKWIKFAIGMAGTILFQNFLKLTTFDHVLVFLYLTVAWLANLVLHCRFGDFGVFNFLLGNVIIGCTVNQFGLRGTTWLAYGASLLLYGLRLKIMSLPLVKRNGELYLLLF